MRYTLNREGGAISFFLGWRAQDIEWHLFSGEEYLSPVTRTYISPHRQRTKHQIMEWKWAIGDKNWFLCPDWEYGTTDIWRDQDLLASGAWSHKEFLSLALICWQAHDRLFDNLISRRRACSFEVMRGIDYCLAIGNTNRLGSVLDLAVRPSLRLTDSIAVLGALMALYIPLQSKWASLNE